MWPASVSNNMIFAHKAISLRLKIGVETTVHTSYRITIFSISKGLSFSWDGRTFYFRHISRAADAAANISTAGNIFWGGKFNAYVKS